MHAKKQIVENAEIERTTKKLRFKKTDRRERRDREGETQRESRQLDFNSKNDSLFYIHRA